MRKLTFYVLILLLMNFAFGKEYIWQWHRVDCTYKHNIESLFKHCSPLAQELIEEARIECGEDNWGKLQKWVDCGAPEKVIIGAKNIQEAYKAYKQYASNEEWLFEKLPLQNVKKDIDDYDSFVQYIWKSNAYLKIYYAYEMVVCNYVYFSDMGNGNIAIVRGEAMCERIINKKE